MSGMNPNSTSIGLLLKTQDYVPSSVGALTIAAVVATTLVCGCTTGKPSKVRLSSAATASEETKLRSTIKPASLDRSESDAASLAQADHAQEHMVLAPVTLGQLESAALSVNPRLRKLTQEWNAALSRVGYVGGLPDPKLGANIFMSPIETAAGSQRANLSVSQVIPSLERLDAKKQQACCHALELQQTVLAEQLRITADIRELWYRLWFIDRQIELAQENRELVKNLIAVANSRVSTGNAAQGDVLAGTLQYARIEEQLVSLKQQRKSTLASLNHIVGRPVETALTDIELDTPTLPAWDHQLLRDLAWAHQPLIQSARIRTQATRWGIEMARLERRPEFSVSASWFEIDGNRPQPAAVDVGQDAWSLGATVSVPLWEQKYDAIENEARWKHSAAHAETEQLKQQFDAQLLDLWQQCVAAHETIELYRDTILPQARNALEADQKSYSTGTVEFDRIVTDVRALLTLEVGYHRSVAQLATTLARIEQAVGSSSMAQ